MPPRVFKLVTPVAARDGFAVGVQVARPEKSPGHGLPAVSPRTIAEPVRVSDPIPPASGLPSVAGPSAAEPCRAEAAVVVDQDQKVLGCLHNASEFGDGESTCPAGRLER